MPSVAEVIKRNYSEYKSILKINKEYAYEPCRVDYTYDIPDQEKEMIRQRIPFAEDMYGEKVSMLKLTNIVHEILSVGRGKQISFNNMKAFEIYDLVRGGTFTGNCKAYAKVLQDTLIAYGYVCKMIYCKPIDVEPQDCHVVVHAFLRENKSWMILDPALNIYYTDEMGNELDLEKLRQKLITTDAFEIKHIADDRGEKQHIDYLKRKLDDRNILMYMTKNMLRFSAMQSNEESRMEVEYHLVPQNYIEKSFETRHYYKSIGVMHANRYISNPQEFWKIP